MVDICKEWEWVCFMFHVSSVEYDVQVPNSRVKDVKPYTAYTGDLFIVIKPAIYC